MTINHKLSPEYRDMDAMERWYRQTGDIYALWLIEQIREHGVDLEVNEECESALYDVLRSIEEETDAKINEYDRDFEKVTNDFFEFKEAYNGDLKDDVDGIFEKLESLHDNLQTFLEEIRSRAASV